MIGMTQIDRLTDWKIDWLIRWRASWLADWLIAWLIEKLTDRLNAVLCSKHILHSFIIKLNLKSWKRAGKGGSFLKRVGSEFLDDVLDIFSCRSTNIPNSPTPELIQNASRSSRTFPSSWWPGKQLSLDKQKQWGKNRKKKCSFGYLTTSLFFLVISLCSLTVSSEWLRY